MGKQKKNNNNNQGPAQKNNSNGNNEKKDNSDKKDNNGISVAVLKLDLFCKCEGCSSKIIKCIRGITGVASVKRVDGDLNKVSVVGSLDPAELREKIEKKMNRKVELISPAPNTVKDNSKNKNGGGDAKQNEKEGKPEKQQQEKKSQEPPVTTVVMKMQLHCKGCTEKIQRVVRKSRGYLDISIDRTEDLVTVKGVIDGKLIAESLKEKLKRPVEIVEPKKEGGGAAVDKKKGGGGGGGGDKGKAPSKDQGGDGKAKARNAVVKFEQQRMEQEEMGHPYPYPHPNVYGPGYMVYAPQLFSDENPDACSVM